MAAAVHLTFRRSVDAEFHPGEAASAVEGDHFRRLFAGLKGQLHLFLAEVNVDRPKHTAGAVFVGLAGNFRPFDVVDDAGIATPFDGEDGVFDDFG